MRADHRQRMLCLWSYGVAVVVLVWLACRGIRLDLDYLLEKEKSSSSSGRAGNYSRLEYLADPLTHRVLKRDAGSRDFRSACFDFSGNSSKQVMCTPSFSVAGMFKSGSSALYFYLKHHPQLALMRKEVCALDYPSDPMFASMSVPYFNGLPSIESVCKDCLVGEGCIGLGRRDAAAYRFAIPSLSTILLLLRHPAKHKYASYWFWCTPEEIKSNIGECGPGQGNWNPRKNVTFIDANNTTQWYNFPR